MLVRYLQQLNCNLSLAASVRMREKLNTLLAPSNLTQAPDLTRRGEAPDEVHDELITSL